MHLGYRRGGGARQGNRPAGLADDRLRSEALAGTVLAGEAPAAASPATHRGRGVKVALAAAGLALAIGVVVRFVAHSHLWLDEALAVNISRLPLGDIPAALRHDGAPPLYYFLLHGWMAAFGTGTIAVRALSGLFAVAALPLVWLAGRRLAGRQVAWAAVLLLATSPFGVRYATEARMYSLLTLLTLVGYLALTELLERGSARSALVVAVTTGLLVLTHYWSWYLLAVVVALVAGRAVRGPEPEHAKKALVAMAAGCLLFVPWLPAFFFQMRHTGTPWGGRPGVRPVFDAVFDFEGGFWDPGFVLGLLAYGLIGFAVFGRAVDRRRIEFDLHTRPRARPLAVAAFGTLAVAVAAGMVTGSVFAVRYAAVVFPLFILLSAQGTDVLADRRLRWGTLALAGVLGLVATGPNVFGERTTAARVARALRAQAHPGDVVAYCPDQLGPSVSRMLGTGLVQVTFPDGGRPERVDWVDYARRNRAATTAPFAARLLSLAGPTHDIWLVWAPGYRTLGTKCSALVTRLSGARPGLTRVVKITTQYMEHPGLVRFRPG